VDGRQAFTKEEVMRKINVDEQPTISSVVVTVQSTDDDLHYSTSVSLELCNGESGIAYLGGGNLRFSNSDQSLWQSFPLRMVNATTSKSLLNNATFVIKASVQDWADRWIFNASLKVSCSDGTYVIFKFDHILLTLPSPYSQDEVMLPLP
jgi:hypothetical protein